MIMEYEYYDQRAKAMATEEGVDIEWLRSVDESLREADRIRSYDVDMIREADNMFNTLIHFANCASFDPGRDYQGVEEREICRFANKIQMIVSEANQ